MSINWSAVSGGPRQRLLLLEAGPARRASIHVRGSFGPALQNVLELFFRQMAHRFLSVNPISFAYDRRWLLSWVLARLVRLLTVPIATPVISATSC